MHFAYMVLQSGSAVQIPDFLKQIGIVSAEALVFAAIAVLIVVLVLRWLTMWWFGVTTVVDRLNRVIGRLEGIERAIKGNAP